MSATPSTFISDIPAGVGPIQRFLFACAEHGRLTGKVKTLKIDGEASLVLSQTEHLRRVLRVSGAEYWIPRETVANKNQRKRESCARASFRRRQKTLWRPYAGEKRPPHETHTTVPLGGKTLSWAEIVELVDDLGFPFYAAVMRGSLPPPLRDPEPRKTRKELGEIVVVKTVFNQMPPEQREQKEDHDKLMKVLAGLRMSPDRASAAYKVIVLGHEVREVAEGLGLNRKLLAVTVSKVRAKMCEPDAKPHVFNASGNKDVSQTSFGKES
jgi:hypothetical protein